MPYWVAFCKKWIYRFGSLQDESLCTVWQTDLRIVYANTFFFLPKAMLVYADFSFYFFSYLVCSTACWVFTGEKPLVSVLYSTQAEAARTVSAGTGSTFSMNMEGTDDVETFVREKSLNTCILSYVTETFIMMHSFWTAYYADVLFMNYFCRNSVGSYFTSLSWICYDFIFFLLNGSLYRQHYFWDVDTCCRPRTQLFVEFNDCWWQLNSHESVA